MAESTLRLAPFFGKPGKVEDVRCMPSQPDNLNVPKGDRTYNHLFQVNMKADVGRRMLAWRLKGEEVGNHFHPRAPNKDPEVFEFIYGDIDIVFTDIFGNTRTVEVRIQLGGAPVYCTVPPYILHILIIKSEQACFEEFQEGPFDPAVNYTAAEFIHFCQEYGVWKG